MSSAFSEPRFIIATAIAIIAVVTIAIVKSNNCRSIECWGSKAQIQAFVEDKKILKKLKKTNKRWAYSNSFARARVFNKKYKDKWFADWWRTNHWDYTLFSRYNSREECYQAAYKRVYRQRYADKIKSLEEAVKKINASTPVRCFPAGTPVSSRWKYKPSTLKN